MLAEVVREIAERVVDQRQGRKALLASSAEHVLRHRGETEQLMGEIAVKRQARRQEAGERLSRSRDHQAERCAEVGHKRGELLGRLKGLLASLLEETRVDRTAARAIWEATVHGGN